MDSSEDEIYINEGYIEGPKPQISIQKKEELLKKGYDSTCKISIPDVKNGNGFFCQFFYNGKNYKVLILNNKIIGKEYLKKKKYLKIKYENKNIVILIEDKILDLIFKITNIILLK